MAAVICICGEQVDDVRRGYKRCPYCSAELKVNKGVPTVRIPENSLDERKRNGKPVNSSRPLLIEWVYEQEK